MKELQIQRNHVYGADCKIILGFSAAARVSTPKPHVIQGSTVVLATTKNSVFSLGKPHHLSKLWCPYL